MAGYLILSSYSDWQESPISSSITTHPIAELDFPTVTVCPPRGSHTALNYDLMKMDNETMIEEDKIYLMQAAYGIFFVNQHLEYAEAMLAATTTENIRNVYDGFQSIPGPYVDGFEVRVRGSSGTIRSPGFREGSHWA